MENSEEKYKLLAKRFLQKIEYLEDFEQKASFFSERIHSLEHITEKLMERLEKLEQIKEQQCQNNASNL